MVNLLYYRTIIILLNIIINLFNKLNFKTRIQTRGGDNLKFGSRYALVPKFFFWPAQVPLGTHNIFSCRYPWVPKIFLFTGSRYPWFGSPTFFFGWYPVPIGTQKKIFWPVLFLDFFSKIISYIRGFCFPEV